MLCKWIVCKVHEETREAFDAAQAKWGGLKTVDGCIGQFGGWNVKDQLEACIVAFWRDQQAFEAFMNVHHDPIYATIGQQETYHHISVAVYDVTLEIPGSAVSLQAALSSGELLRVTENYLYEGRDAHFIEQQQQVWNPGMKAQAAMLGGVFGRKRGETGPYLAVTVWENEAAHNKYVETDVPTLRARSSVAGDVESIVGRIVRLEPRWNVTP